MADDNQLPPEELDDLFPEVEDPEDAYSAQYLLACAGAEARSERLAELRRRIELGAYQIDPTQIADHFLTRRTDGDD